MTKNKLDKNKSDITRNKTRGLQLDSESLSFSQLVSFHHFGQSDRVSQFHSMSSSQ